MQELFQMVFGFVMQRKLREMLLGSESGIIIYYAVSHSPNIIMKVINKRPYNCADFFLVRSCGYQNRLTLGEIKPISNHTKHVKINRNNTFSKSINSGLADV